MAIDKCKINGMKEIKILDAENPVIAYFPKEPTSQLVKIDYINVASSNPDENDRMLSKMLQIIRTDE